jgi:hypothetical protein
VAPMARNVHPEPGLGDTAADLHWHELPPICGYRSAHAGAMKRRFRHQEAAMAYTDIPWSLGGSEFRSSGMGS